MCVEKPSIHPDVHKKKMMKDLENKMIADALVPVVPPSTGEWERYLQQPLCDRTKENSLQWWKKKESEFPRLSKVARVLLCAMPTSAPCEYRARVCFQSLGAFRIIVAVHSLLQF